jgi:hypothetical protein
MSSLKANFNELVERMRHGRDFAQASFEPIYYLVFPPSEILEVKRSLPAWSAKLRNDGWDVHRFSIAEQIWDILQHANQRKLWLAADKKSPLAWKKANESLANALVQGKGGPLQERLEELLKRLEGQKNAVVLVTDLEALHPYLRIGAIESQLYGQFHVPTVFLYPGERTGKTRLRFLGFYPEDGNYRSVHVGG